MPEAGLYILQQVIGTPYDLALQWYHYRKTTLPDGTPALAQLNFDSHFKSYAIPPQVPILDGDEIVWRLVTIETSPISSPCALSEALRNSGQSKASVL